MKKIYGVVIYSYQARKNYLLNKESKRFIKNYETVKAQAMSREDAETLYNKLVNSCGCTKDASTHSIALMEYSEDEVGLVQKVLLKNYIVNLYL